MGYGDTFNFFDYTGDDGANYVVKLSTAVATEGGFAANVSGSGTPPWGYGPKNMRHVWGKSASGKRAKLPIADPTDTKFVDGGTFTLHSTPYSIQGAIGERRARNALGG